MNTITTELKIEIQDGPADISIPSIEIKNKIEGIDKININIKSSEQKEFTIESSSNKVVSFLLITSNLYTPNYVEDDKKQLTFQIGDDSTKSINLSFPQFYVGKDAISKLFGVVQKITFKNNLEKKKGEFDEDESDGDESTTAQISIFIGRDA